MSKRIGIFIEDEWVDYSYFPILNTFKEAGIQTTLITTYRPWDNGLRKSIPNKPGDIVYHMPVDLSISEVKLNDFNGFVFGGGYWADRLRWWFHNKLPDDVPQNPSPGDLVRSIVESNKHTIGVICHSMWILNSFNNSIKKKKVTCAYNIIDDVTNAGFHYIDQDVVVDGNLVSGRMSANSLEFTQKYIEVLG